MNTILSLQLFDDPIDSGCTDSTVSCKSDVSCKSEVSRLAS